MTDPHVLSVQPLIAAGRVGEAIAALELAIENGEESAAIAKLLAQLSLRINEVRAFQNWCHEALRMDPNDLEVYQMLEAYFRDAGRDFEADEVLEAITRRAAPGGSPPAG